MRRMTHLDKKMTEMNKTACGLANHNDSTCNQNGEGYSTSAISFGGALD